MQMYTYLISWRGESFYQKGESSLPSTKLIFSHEKNNTKVARLQ